MTIKTEGTDVPMNWTEPLKAPLSVAHTDLPEVLARIQIGIEQARRGEGRLLEDKDFPTDDDE